MRTVRPRKRHRGRAIDPKVQQAIEELAVKGRTPAQIRKLFEVSDEYAWIETVPPAHTIKRIVWDVTPPNDADTWALSPDADPADARAVLDVLAAVIEQTGGRITSFTQHAAEWIAFLARAAPGLPAWETYKLARRYMLCEHRQEPTGDLDALLAFAPWRDGHACRRYLDALEGAYERVPVQAAPGWKSLVPFHVYLEATERLGPHEGALAYIESLPEQELVIEDEGGGETS